MVSEVIEAKRTGMACKQQALASVTSEAVYVDIE